VLKKIFDNKYVPDPVHVVRHSISVLRSFYFTSMFPSLSIIVNSAKDDISFKWFQNRSIFLFLDLFYRSACSLIPLQLNNHGRYKDNISDSLTARHLLHFYILCEQYKNLPTSIVMLRINTILYFHNQIILVNVNIYPLSLPLEGIYRIPEGVRCPPWRREGGCEAAG